MTDEELLTPDETFQSLKVGRAKGFQLLASGELKSIKIGRLRRIPRQSLREFIANRMAENIGRENEG